jgi:hypothetical protein
VLVSIAFNYKGRCGVFWVFGGAGRPCPFSEYMRREAGLVFFLMLVELWWLILPALALLPFTGYLMGRHRRSESVE